ncbi:hypothetical protein NVP1101O_077 [Vibrio phage 1.101.O._10N.261.45.C6]|nr:hypothetical protein NVP1101O_077 [Vibrio phage 1.101.O._10N.261.45.C6]
MNVEQILRQIRGEPEESVLTRNPTTTELDEFIDRCLKEHDMNYQMLYNNIVFKIQPPENAVTMTSFAENEIYPMVLNRIQERVSGENR